MADNANNNNNPAAEAAVAVAIVEENKPKQEADQKEEKKIRTSKIFNVKHISGLLSVVSFLLSLPILASVIWLLYMKSYDCEDLFKLPSLQIWISVGLIFVFLICNASLFLQTRFPMLGIIVIMVPLTMMFVVGLALLGANNMESRRIPATPLWFKTKIRDNGLWSNVKSCIYDTKVCQDLAITSMELESFELSNKKLSAIETADCV
ncbi:hypothetical protein COLO4_18038 [Corchorus olitorius]|uniref:Uncharacterized protein n=1 Tax=Corchorus olitorius TaxID=93759 RepID=A0A1R3JAN6_9ROSI|nr:hypothetical protein COLO4_18038 [Corchorus olitorius]